MKKMLNKIKYMGTGKFKGAGHKLGNGEEESNTEEPPAPTAAPQVNSHPRPVEPPQPLPQESAPEAQIADRSKVLQAALERQKPQVKQVKMKMMRDPLEGRRNQTSISAGGSNPTVSSNADEGIQLNVGLLASLDAGGNSAAVLKRILVNIISNPSEAKYRKLRLDNPKIAAAIGSVDSARGFLEACKFKTIKEEESEYLVLEDGEDITPVKDGLHELERAFPTPRPKNVVSPESIRNTQLLLPKPTDAEVPDYFFKRMGAEIKAEFLTAKKRLEDSQILMTSQQREAMMKKDTPTYTAARVRVRMPEGVLLQGAFLGRENVTKIYEWVMENLRFPGREFELHSPTKQLGTSGTIASENLMPATLLNFRWLDSSFMNEALPSIKDELVSAAKMDWE